MKSIEKGLSDDQGTVGPLNLLLKYISSMALFENDSRISY